jgi:hypothetical protein
MKIALLTLLLCANVATALWNHYVKNHKTAMFGAFTTALALDLVMDAIIEG